MAKKNPAATESFIRNPDAVLREEGPDGALLFNPDTNQVRVINATGLFIWKQCNGRKDVPAIVAAMRKTFAGVPAGEVEAQVRDFIANLRSGGFLGLPGETRN